jgi:hypothetical protein
MACVCVLADRVFVAAPPPSHPIVYPSAPHHVFLSAHRNATPLFFSMPLAVERQQMAALLEEATRASLSP